MKFNVKEHVVLNYGMERLIELAEIRKTSWISMVP